MLWITLAMKYSELPLMSTSKCLKLNN
uniref:Uncharacterized protein n=1 Tax=Anguilla anguilla TaxID=7936 RepID=A0A0E9URF3_ANGAN